MTHSGLKYALLLSLLLNVGVVLAVGYRAASGGLPPITTTQQDAADYLKLTPEQRRRWQALESDFLPGFAAGIRDIALHREQLIRAIFSDPPSPERIKAEREAIARLQQDQQQRVISQLLKEREILDSKQQQALAELLLREAPAATAVERVHRR